MQYHSSMLSNKCLPSNLGEFCINIFLLFFFFRCVRLSFRFFVHIFSSDGRRRRRGNTCHGSIEWTDGRTDRSSCKNAFSYLSGLLLIHSSPFIRFGNFTFQKIQFRGLAIPYRAGLFARRWSEEENKSIFIFSKWHTNELGSDLCVTEKFVYRSPINRLTLREGREEGKTGNENSKRRSD